MKKIFIMLALVAVAAAASAQVSFKSTYDATHDTVKVTNGETAQLIIRNGGAASSTTIQVNVTKTSGTVAGTITLQASMDGSTNWKALNTSLSQTALATITATDATNTYHWWFLGNPFPYYRVSWTGTGTMVATASAKILSR